MDWRHTKLRLNKIVAGILKSAYANQPETVDRKRNMLAIILNIKLNMKMCLSARVLTSVLAGVRYANDDK